MGLMFMNNLFSGFAIYSVLCRVSLCELVYWFYL